VEGVPAGDLSSEPKGTGLCTRSRAVMPVEKCTRYDSRTRETFDRPRVRDEVQDGQVRRSRSVVGVPVGDQRRQVLGPKQ